MFSLRCLRERPRGAIDGQFDGHKYCKERWVIDLTARSSIQRCSDGALRHNTDNENDNDTDSDNGNDNSDRDHDHSRNYNANQLIQQN